MAVRLDGHHFGELYDYWGGHSDLQKGLIRVLHSLSFVDDPTRILRAIRFEQRFGFSIEERTLALVSEAKELLEKVSGDRIRHEIDLILEEPKAPEMLARINKLNLLHPLFENIHWDAHILRTLRKFYKEELPSDWFTQENQKIMPKKAHGAYLLITAQENQIKILKILQWLRLKNHLAQMIIQTNLLWHQLDSLRKLTPSQVTRKLQEYSQLEIYCVYVLCPDESIKKVLEDFALNWRWIKPFTDGIALQKLGLKTGPAYSDILNELKAAWIDNKIINQEEELEYLQTLIKKAAIK